MKKKTKKKLRLLLAFALLGALAWHWLAPGLSKAPKMNWRVPVNVAVPKLPEMPTLPMIAEEAAPIVDAWESIKDHPLPFEEKLPPEEAVPPPPPLPAVPPPPIKLKQGERPRIALIIDDMGLASALSARAARLPPFVTLAYLPYAPNVQAQVDTAKAKGHDVMLHLPMQPMGSANPGKGALRVDQDEATWQRLVMESFSSFDGFVGVNNHMGSRFTADSDGMRLVAEAVKEEGVFFIDSRTNPRSVAEDVMRQAGVPTLARDVFLDDTVSPAAIRGELARLEVVARRAGQGVAIGHPHAATLEALENWIPDAQARGFTFVPVRQMVK